MTMEHRRSSFGSDADDRALVYPAMNDPSRVGTRSSSVFSLVATLVGGGCLSLPFAFHKTGLVLGPLYLLASGLLSGYSMRLLLSCSRRTGAQTYEECGEKAFGSRMKFVTMGLLIVVTFLASVAYLILARDLATPLVENYIVGHKFPSSDKHSHNFVALIILAPIAPLCYAKSLHSLRFASIISLISLGVLTAAVVYRSIDRDHERPINWKEITFASADLESTMYAIPFFELSFMAHFNLLPVHVGLRKPTRARLNQVVSVTIGSSYSFYMLISMAGYLFAYDHKCGEESSSACTEGVPDNILNAFDLTDTLINVGRFGFLLVLLLSFPLLVLPCRDTLLRLAEEIAAKKQPFSEEDEQVEDALVQDSLVPMSDCPDSPEFQTPFLNRQIERLAREQSASISLSTTAGRMHFGITTIILICVVVSTITIPGVAVVWNVTGSTVAMLLSFVFPAIFYIKIRNRDQFFSLGNRDSRLLCAWGLFVASILTTLMCTIESFKQLI